MGWKGVGDRCIFLDVEQRKCFYSVKYFSLLLGIPIEDNTGNKQLKIVITWDSWNNVIARGGGRSTNEMNKTLENGFYTLQKSFFPAPFKMH